MKAIRITYNVYFSNDQVKENSPCHSFARNFEYIDKESFIKERFAFEKKVASFRRCLRSLYKMVSVDKSIQYFGLEPNEI